VADTTILQVTIGDISNVTVSDNDVTAITVQDTDITTIIGAPTTITLERILTLSDGFPSDVARTANAGVLEIASRADHVHSIANTLLDGGNY